MTITRKTDITFEDTFIALKKIRNHGKQLINLYKL